MFLSCNILEKAFLSENMPNPVKLHTPNHFQYTPDINLLTHVNISSVAVFSFATHVYISYVYLQNTAG